MMHVSMMPISMMLESMLHVPMMPYEDQKIRFWDFPPNTYFVGRTFPILYTCFTQNWNIALNTASPSMPLPRVSRPLVNAWKTKRPVVRHSIWPPDCFREEIQPLHFQLPGTCSCQPLSSLGFLSFQNGQDDTESYIFLPIFHIFVLIPTVQVW